MVLDSICVQNDGRMGKSVIVFEANMNSSLHIDNKGKDILIFGLGPTQGLDNSRSSIFN